MITLIEKYQKPLVMVAIFWISIMIQVLALNAFLISNNIFSGGFNGIAQLLSLLS
jgi:uncharacterized membrane-anchored protein YitT (DUF2179 family)